MRKFLLGFLSAVGLIGVILSLIMFITAIRFGELGRVILYFFTLLICVEMSVFFAMKLFGKKKDTP